MDQQRYYDRKQYVEQARNSFGEYTEKRKHSDYDYGRERAEIDRPPRNYFKLRLALSAILFAGFCLIQFTGWSYQDISAETIRDEIQTGIALPESFPQFSDLTAILKSED